MSKKLAIAVFILFSLNLAAIRLLGPESTSGYIPGPLGWSDDPFFLMPPPSLHGPAFSEWGPSAGDSVDPNEIVGRLVIFKYSRGIGGRPWRIGRIRGYNLETREHSIRWLDGSGRFIRHQIVSRFRTRRAGNFYIVPPSETERAASRPSSAESRRGGASGGRDGETAAAEQEIRTEQIGPFLGTFFKVMLAFPNEGDAWYLIEFVEYDAEHDRVLIRFQNNDLGWFLRVNLFDEAGRLNTDILHPTAPPESGEEEARRPLDESHSWEKEMVGRRIKVRWRNGANEPVWYSGVISAYNAASGEHHIDYDDGDDGDYRLRDETGDLLNMFQLLEPESGIEVADAIVRRDATRRPTRAENARTRRDNARSALIGLL